MTFEPFSDPLHISDYNLIPPFTMSVSLLTYLDSKMVASLGVTASMLMLYRLLVSKETDPKKIELIQSCIVSSAKLLWVYLPCDEPILFTEHNLLVHVYPFGDIDSFDYRTSCEVVKVIPFSIDNFNNLIEFFLDKN